MEVFVQGMQLRPLAARPQRKVGKPKMWKNLEEVLLNAKPNTHSDPLRISFPASLRSSFLDISDEDERKNPTKDIEDSKLPFTVNGIENEATKGIPTWRQRQNSTASSFGLSEGDLEDEDDNDPVCDSSIEKGPPEECVYTPSPFKSVDELWHDLDRECPDISLNLLDHLFISKNLHPVLFMGDTDGRREPRRLRPPQRSGVEASTRLSRGLSVKGK